MSKIFDKTKKWYMSKTLWSNLLIVLGGVSTWAAGNIEAGVPITAMGLLNIVLRIATEHKLIK